tara:strand:+ start:1307 stop:1486 length:180 start_codon:yes stop_codon:yes gene_type:complete
MIKTYKVIFDETRSYEIEVKAKSKQNAREIASHIVNDAEPDYIDWEHHSTEEVSDDNNS